VGGLVSRVEQLDWDWTVVISWMQPGKGAVSWDPWPFLGTQFWPLAQVLGKDECVEASEDRREEQCGILF
jgi:hypothetical protein